MILTLIFDSLGCSQIATIDFSNHSDLSRRLQIQYLDLTDCFPLDDNGLRTVVQNCPQLVYLYLRRCTQITGWLFHSVPSDLRGFTATHIDLIFFFHYRFRLKICAQLLCRTAGIKRLGLCEYHRFRSIRASQTRCNAAIFIGGQVRSSIRCWIESHRTPML